MSAVGHWWLPSAVYVSFKSDTIGALVSRRCSLKDRNTHIIEKRGWYAGCWAGIFYGRGREHEHERVGWRGRSFKKSREGSAATGRPSTPHRTATCCAAWDNITIPS